GRAGAVERRAEVGFGQRFLRRLGGRDVAVGGPHARSRPRGARQVGGDARNSGGDERSDRAEHGDDGIHERVAQRDRVDPSLRRGDEDRDGGAAGGSLAREAERGGKDAARAERQRSADGGRPQDRPDLAAAEEPRDRKSTRLNSSHVAISYAVFCLKKKKKKNTKNTWTQKIDN